MITGSSTVKQFLWRSDRQKNLRAVAALSLGKRAAVLVDISRASGVSQECRELFASPQCADLQYAVGIVANSRVGHLIGNFFLGFNQPLFPLKIFTENSTAMEWLTSIKNNEKKQPTYR
ncbi:DUF7793 family protein [Echinicola rosea]